MKILPFKETKYDVVKINAKNSMNWRLISSNLKNSDWDLCW